jgi:hypothetical protein
MRDRIVPRVRHERGFMDDAKRIALIIEAVRYCQRVKTMGMPATCYSKALREPIHFLWERRAGKGKAGSAKFRSRNAIGIRIGGGLLRYDHAIPFKLLVKELLNLTDVSDIQVISVLERFGTIVLITKDEEDRINAKGLGHRMPDGWDGIDPLARYKAVGIELVENS